jgi:hypothetical protein
MLFVMKRGNMLLVVLTLFRWFGSGYFCLLAHAFTVMKGGNDIFAVFNGGTCAICT